MPEGATTRTESSVSRWLARGIDVNSRVVGGGRLIDDASNVSETTAEAARVWERQQRIRRRDDGPEELATTAESSAEEDEPKDSTTTTEASAEEAEETTRPSERLQLRRRQCIYGPRELTTKTAASAEEYGLKDSGTLMEASAEDEE